MWVSEYTPMGYPGGDSAMNMQGGLTLARNILTDFHLLHPTGWVYWQAVETGRLGLLKAPYDQPHARGFTITPLYYALGQFSRFIRPGARIIDTQDNNTLAAYDPTAHTLTLVAVNDNNPSAERTVAYDLSHFSARGGSVSAYRTSAALLKAGEGGLFLLPSGTARLQGGGRDQLTVTLPAQSITTYIVHAVRTE